MINKDYKARGPQPRKSPKKLAEHYGIPRDAITTYWTEFGNIVIYGRTQYEAEIVASPMFISMVDDPIDTTRKYYTFKNPYENRSSL